MGYSCVPVTKDEDGLVVLVLTKKEADVRAQQQQLVESIHKILGNHQTLTVNVDGVKALPNDQYAPRFHTNGCRTGSLEFSCCDL